jgi:hypothetical protein
MWRNRVSHVELELALRSAAMASTLIAVLQGARDGALSLDQPADWRPIRVTRRAD